MYTTKAELERYAAAPSAEGWRKYKSEHKISFTFDSDEIVRHVDIKVIDLVSNPMRAVLSLGNTLRSKLDPTAFALLCSETGRLNNDGWVMFSKAERAEMRTLVDSLSEERRAEIRNALNNLPTANLHDERMQLTTQDERRGYELESPVPSSMQLLDERGRPYKR